MTYVDVKLLEASRDGTGQVVAPDEETHDLDERPWPVPMDNEAYHGVAGEIALALAPDVEPAPEALLTGLLVVAGVCMGGERRMHLGSWQAPNLFACIVGPSATSRKGTGDALVSEVFQLAYPDYRALLVPGLGSGEGLIHALQSRTDKRVLVKSSEFGGLLTVASRQGQILSAVLRDAYDGVPLGRQLAREDAIVDYTTSPCWRTRRRPI